MEHNEEDIFPLLRRRWITMERNPRITSTVFITANFEFVNFPPDDKSIFSLRYDENTEIPP